MTVINNQINNTTYDALLDVPDFRSLVFHQLDLVRQNNTEERLLTQAEITAKIRLQNANLKDPFNKL